MSDETFPHLQERSFQLSPADLSILTELLDESLPAFSAFLQTKTLGITNKDSNNHEIFYDDRMTTYLNKYSKMPPASSSICKEVSSNPLLLSLSESGGFDERVIETFVSLQHQFLKNTKDGRVDFVEDNYFEPCSYWVLEDESPDQLNARPREFNKLKFEANVSPLNPGKATSLSSLLLSNELEKLASNVFHIQDCNAYRPYLEVEEEEKFLEEHVHLFPDLQPLKSWKELFPFYNENLDTPDGSWLIRSLEKQKRIEEKQSTRKKQKLAENRRYGDAAKDPLFLNRPIAVSCTHPASISTSSTLRPLLSEAPLFSTIHPAFVHCPVDPAPPNRSHDRCLNLVDLALDTLRQSLCDIESRNFSRLCQVRSRATREHVISEKCRKKKQTLDEILFRTYRHNEPKQSGRVIYAKSSSSYSSRSPRDANRQLSKHPAPLRLGACDPCHVPSGYFVSSLKVGDRVNVKIGECSCRGLIIAVKRDREMIRLLKVKIPEINDIRWISVESGLLTEVESENPSPEHLGFYHDHPWRSQTAPEQEPNVAGEKDLLCAQSSQQQCTNAPVSISAPSAPPLLPFVTVQSAQIVPAIPVAPPMSSLLISQTVPLQQVHTPIPPEESLCSVLAPMEQAIVDPRLFISPLNPRVYALVANNHRQIVTHSQSLLIPPVPPAPCGADLQSQLLQAHSDSPYEGSRSFSAPPLHHIPHFPLPGQSAAYSFHPVAFPQVQPSAPYMPYSAPAPAPRPPIFTETFRLLPGGIVKKNH